MRISVIIPFYNNYKSILRTLESLAVQSPPVFEVIIVDDCSDNENEIKLILEPISKILPISLLRNKENKNGAYSRNRGILSSKGEIIAFLDADDLWASNKTKRIIECVEQFGIDNLFFSNVKINVNGVTTSIRPKHYNSNVHISEYLFLEDGFIQTSSIFCSSKIAKEILFQEQFRRHQDYDFVLRAANKNINFQFIDEELTIYSSDAKVNLSKGEAFRYSKWWSKEMKKYFSKSGYKGFQIFNLTARLIAEKRYVKAICNMVISLMGLSLLDYKRIYPKMKRLIIEAKKQRK